MVMSISFVNKLRVLERISPPLAASEATTRGPVIAVEGPDARLVKAVAGVVERALKAASAVEDGGGWLVRCWEDESVSSDRWGQQQGGGLGSGDGDGDGGGGEDVHMPEAVAAATSSTTSSSSINPFMTYLRTITDWHAKSAEIVKFVSGTSKTETDSSTTASTTPKQNIITSDYKAERESTAPSAGPSTTQRHPLPNKHPASPPPSGQKKPTKPKLPIALLPSGFSLTLSDRFACAVPISDAYAPIDHWQWMATLWRGIVGADLVVYVSPRAHQAQVPYQAGVVDEASSSTGGGGIMGGGGGGGVVEVRSPGLIVVKVPAPAPVSVSVSVPVVGSGSGLDEDGGGVAAVAVDEKMERRLGFEVVEWVRSSGWVNIVRPMDGQTVMEY
jgi:HMG box factor